MALVPFHRLAKHKSRYPRCHRCYIAHTFSSEQFLALDNRRRLFSSMANLPDLLHSISYEPATPTWDPRDTFQAVSHSYGLKRLVANIPDDVATVKIYSRPIRDHCYVCGICWSSASGESLVGTTSERKTSLSFTKSRLYFIADQLGIKIVKFGDSPWAPEKPKGWEGLSIFRGCCELIVTSDVRKLTSLYFL